MERSKELAIPPLVEEDTNAFEILRIWVAFKSQHMSVRLDTLKDPAEWGILLVDTIKLIAKGYKEQQGKNFEEVVARIVAGLEAELSVSTDQTATQ